MDGVPINCRFGTIKIYQFGKWTGNPIFNEKYSITQNLIPESDIMKNHRHDDYGTRKTENKTPKHEKFKKRNKIGEKEEKAIKKISSKFQTKE